MFISLRLSVLPDGTILIGLSLELYVGTLPVAGRYKSVARFYIPFVFRLKNLNNSKPTYWNKSTIYVYLTVDMRENKRLLT